MTYSCANCGEQLNASVPHDCLAKNNGGSTSYYHLPLEAKEMQDLIEHRNMNFAQGNMFKALYRANSKDNKHSSYERDLNKIIWYAKRELARLKGQ